jgi:putative Mg2+ transporter-C (MgtC) family protein
VHASGAVSVTENQGWVQLVDLGLALVLCSLIGLEREIRQKAAGLRTHALVGLGAGLFMLVSKYGFGDLLGLPGIALDPSRVAAQIVSGIGFIGGGLIFVRRDDVRGLTTAATIWLAAAVGAACGASLPLLAGCVTAAYFLVALGYPPLARRLPRSRLAASPLQLTYVDGTGALRAALRISTRLGYRVNAVDIVREPTGVVSDEGHAQLPHPRAVVVALEVSGTGSVAELGAALVEIDGVLSVHAGDANEVIE